jgi:hypothetical protein
MKDVHELVVTVVDYGTFISLAEKLAETCAVVNYHVPINVEFRTIQNSAIGYGVPSLTRIESFMHPDVVKETDLYCFPDIGYGGEQQYLRSIGKPVWGSNGGDVLERLRTRFIDTVKELGLPMVKSVKLHGLSDLVEFLKDKTDWWVKINEFRGNMETWKHIDHEHSQAEYARLAVEFGGARDLVWFVAQEDIPDAQEIGYDGWSVDEWFPDSSYQGYEAKNELYLGARTDYDKLPEGVRAVNEKWSSVLSEYKYRNFIATEIRMVDGVPHFIDPTQRMPGQTGEQLLETLENLPEVIWKGAQGELVVPQWNADFAASATIHHEGDHNAWRLARVPEESKPMAKLCRYMQAGDLYHFPPGKSDDLGVVIGMADSIEATIDVLNENFEAIGDDSLSINTEGFKDLLEQIKEAEKEGIEFTDQPVPEPEEVF